jgi:hypothetical protein
MAAARGGSGERPEAEQAVKTLPARAEKLRHFPERRPPRRRWAPRSTTPRERPPTERQVQVIDEIARRLADVFPERGGR